MKILFDGLYRSRFEAEELRTRYVQVVGDVMHFCCRWVANSVFPLVSEVFESEELASSLIHFTLDVGVNHTSRLKEGLSIFVIMLQLLGNETSVEEEPPFVKLLCQRVPMCLSILRIVPENGGADLPSGSSLSLASSSDAPEWLSDEAKDFGGWGALLTSAGMVVPILGTLRLQVLEFLCALLYCGFPILQSHQEYFQDLFAVCIDLLLHFKWNNILHNVITRILSAVFECSEAGVLVDKLHGSKLLQRIVATFKDATSTGNKGHLLQLCQEIVRISQISTQFADYVYSCEGWEDFITGQLDELLYEQEPPVEEGGELHDYDDIMDSNMAHWMLNEEDVREGDEDAEEEYEEFDSVDISYGELEEDEGGSREEVGHVDGTNQVVEHEDGDDMVQ